METLAIDLQRISREIRFSSMYTAPMPVEKFGHALVHATVPELKPLRVPELDEHSDLVQTGDETPVYINEAEAIPVPVSAEVAKHNMLYSIMQRGAEVDPADCFKLVDVDNADLWDEHPMRTEAPNQVTLFSFLSHLSKGEYPVPFEGYQIDQHIKAVSMLHPDLAAVVKELASRGVRLLSTGEKIDEHAAETIGLHLDLFLQEPKISREEEIRILVSASNPTVKLTDAVERASILFDTQIDHMAALDEKAIIS